MKHAARVPTASGARARVPTGLVVAGLAVAALLVALLLALGGGDRAGDGVDPAAGGTGAGVPAPELVAAERAALGPLGPAGASAWEVHDIGVAPGVRLGGPGRLAGRVIERASGRGVGEARVDLMPITPSAVDMLGDMLRLARVGGGMERRALPVAVALTADDGSFAFEGVRAGKYFLDARGQHHVPDELLQVRVDARGSGGPVEFHVRAGSRVLGRVLRPDGRPAARAEVAVVQGPATVITAFRRGELRQIEGRCDDAGRFVLAGVTPGAGYVLHAMGRGFAVSHLDLPVLAPGADVEVELRARPGATVEGRVLSAPAQAPGDEDRGADEDGADAAGEAALVPLRGAELAAVPRGLRDMQYAEEILAATHARTDADGRYVMRDVPPGELDLVAMAPGHAAGTLAALEVPEGQVVRAPDLVLRRGPVLYGTVVDTAGRPLSGVHVRWFTGDMSGMEDFHLTPATLMHQAVGDFRYPTTDAQGRFAAGPFHGRPPHDVYFFLGGYRFAKRSWDPERDGPEIVVEMGRGGTVEGVVVDAATGSPVTSFLVGGPARVDVALDAPSAINPVSGGQLVEDGEGRFRVTDVLPGRSDLVFTAPGYQRHVERRIEVVEGEVTGGLVVALWPGGTVRGTVVDEAGEPVAGAQVVALAGGSWNLGRAFARVQEHRTAGAFADTQEEAFTNAMISFATRMGFLGEGAVTCDAEGRFELESVAAGKVSVVARHRDFALGQSEVFELGRGESVESVEVVLPVGATLYGTVTDRFGRPVPDAVLVAISPTEFSGDHSAEAAVYQGVSDEAGRYAIEHMAGGGYFVVLTRLDAALNPMTLLGRLDLDLVTVAPHGRTRYDVRDTSAAACRVHGRVTSAGEPVRTGGILALSVDAESLVGMDVKMARVAADGTYAFPGLSPGTYEFVYQSRGNELRMDVEVPDLPEHEVDLALPRGGVAGRVVDDRTGAPLADVPVYLVRVDGERPDGFLAQMLSYEGRTPGRTTGADGAFAFHGYAAGEYELYAYPPEDRQSSGEYASAEPLRVSVAEGRTTGGLEIRLGPGLTVSGVVLGPDGAPLPRVRVTALHAERGLPTPDRARTERDGSFVLGSLGPGTYDLHASRSGWAPGLLAGVVVGEHSVEGATIRMHPGVELLVRVLDAEGHPVVGAYANVYRAGGGLARGFDPESDLLGWLAGDRMSGVDGRIQAGAFEPGVYRVEVRRGALRAERDGIEVVEGPPIEVEVRLE